MIKMKSRTLRAALAALAAFGLLMVNDGSPTTSGLFVTRAHAIIGRPLTPMSYAGVARRTTRRAYAAGAYGAYAAPVAAPTYAAPGGCVQVADVYGRLVTQCY